MLNIDFMSILNEKLRKDVLGIKVLWTNTSTTAFSAQTITLNETIANYSYYEIIARFSGVSGEPANYVSTGRIPTNKLARIIDISGGVPNFRDVLSLSGTSMQFDACKYYVTYNSTTTKNYNDSCIPMIVIGYK